MNYTNLSLKSNIMYINVYQLNMQFRVNGLIRILKIILKIMINITRRLAQHIKTLNDFYIIRKK